MWFRIIKKDPFIPFGLRSQFFESNHYKWKYANPCDRPVGCWAGFAEAQNVILFLALFCSTAWKLRNRNWIKENIHIHSISHIHNRFFHSRTHLTNNLIFGTALRTLYTLHSHILFAVYCIVRSNRYKSCVWIDASRRENKFSKCVQRAQRTAYKMASSVQRVGITAFSMYTYDWNRTHNEYRAGHSQVVCVSVFVCLLIYEWTDGWINLYVCPSPYVQYIHACVWVAG